MTTQPQAVTEFMESHGFRKETGGVTSTYWWKRGEHGDKDYLIFDPRSALFFYTICQKAEREARINERNLIVKGMETRYRNYAARNQFTDRDAVAGYDAAFRDIQEETRYNIALLTPPQDTTKQEEEAK